MTKAELYKDGFYYTTGTDQDRIQDFSFPFCNVTMDCREYNDTGLAYAENFKLINI